MENEDSFVRKDGIHPNQHRNKRNDQKNLKELKLTIETVKDCQHEGIIGRNWSLVALKNSKSFLIGTNRKGVLLVEDEIQVFRGQLPVFNKPLKGIVYIPTLNSYFLIHDSNLYRKDINNKPPYLFLKINLYYGVGTSLAYSKINQRLIMANKQQNLLMFNFKRKKIEVQINHFMGRNFRLLGAKEDRVVCVTWDGHVLLYSLNCSKKRGITAFFQVELNVRRKEFGGCVAVCDKHELIFVGIGNSDSFLASRILVLKANEDKLANTASFDCYSEKIGLSYFLECLGYFGTSVLCIGMSYAENGMVHVYEYDTETEELKDLEDKRVQHQEYCTLQLQRLNDRFYYTGFNGLLMSLKAE